MRKEQQGEDAKLTVISTSTHNTDLDAMLRVPSSKTETINGTKPRISLPVHDIQTLARVQVVDGTLTVDHENLIAEFEVDRA